MTIKEKLTEISYRGFDVENIEIIQQLLRDLTHELHAGKFSGAAATTEIIKLRADSLNLQAKRWASREKVCAA